MWSPSQRKGSGRSGSRHGGQATPRPATGEDCMIDVVVCPYSTKRSITSSRCSTSRTCSAHDEAVLAGDRGGTRRPRASRCASSATLRISRGAGRMRMTTLERVAERARVDVGVVAADHAGLLEPRSRSADGGRESPTRRPSSARLTAARPPAARRAAGGSWRRARCDPKPFVAMHAFDRHCTRDALPRMSAAMPSQPSACADRRVPPHAVLRRQRRLPLPRARRSRCCCSRASTSLGVAWLRIAAAALRLRAVAPAVARAARLDATAAGCSSPGAPCSR